MFILRAIGKFFARIGRWIKETAWVQPLLIVGGVFVIIFSITPITKWVQSWFTVGDPGANFYGNSAYKKTLGSAAKTGKSDADKLFNYIEGYYEGNFTQADKDYYGTKFFVAFVEEGCSACDSTYTGFETLQANWNVGQYKIDDGKPFKLHTIFTDEADEDDETYLYFVENFWSNHSEFFEEAVTGVSESPYCKYKEGTDGSSSTYASALEAFGGKATDNNAPIFFLIDFDNTSLEWGPNQYGVTTVLFNFSNDSDCGSTSYDKASYLADCWNYKGVFGKSN